jgi:hypothetical protein
MLWVSGNVTNEGSVTFKPTMAPLRIQGEDIANLKIEAPSSGPVTVAPSGIDGLIPQVSSIHDMLWVSGNVTNEGSVTFKPTMAGVLDFLAVPLRIQGEDIANLKIEAPSSGPVTVAPSGIDLLDKSVNSTEGTWYITITGGVHDVGPCSFLYRQHHPPAQSPLPQVVLTGSFHH